MIILPFNDASAKVHYNTLEPILERRIKYIVKNGIKNGTITPTNRLKAFLLSMPGKFLEHLITARPSEFTKITHNIKNAVPGITNKTTNAGSIFYNLFIDSIYERQFDKLKFIRTINIDTCPYCNRSYIYALEKKFKIKPQVDHFLPKSKFPFLGLSFYNLIPACTICNGFDVKSEKDPRNFGLRNPYMIKQGDFGFKFKFKKVRVMGGVMDPQGIELMFAKAIKGHLRVFKLKELYDLHKDHVVELIIKDRVKYPKSYRADLQNYGLQPKDIDRMILGNYSDENDVHKRPLAKLYQDIGRQLKLIK